jgi:transposase InsO family protein
LDLSKVGLLSNSELAVMLKPDLHLIDWTRAKKKCSKFQEILSSYGIKPVYTTDRSRKSNGVIEQVNFTMGDMLRTMTFSGSDWFSDMQYTLDAVAWAVCTAVNLNIKHSPCSECQLGHDHP